MTDKENKVAFAKMLKTNKYSNRQIQIITDLSQSDISKIINNKLFKNISQEDYEQDLTLEAKKEVVDKVLELKEIAGFSHLEDNDRYYIKLIKLCGGTYENVKEIYSDRPVRDLRPAWDYANQFEYKDFDPALLKIDKEKFDIFINGVKKWQQMNI